MRFIVGVIFHGKVGIYGRGDRRHGPTMQNPKVVQNVKTILS